jgi:predicted transcriptional regulator
MAQTIFIILAFLTGASLTYNIVLYQMNRIFQRQLQELNRQIKEGHAIIPRDALKRILDENSLQVEALRQDLVEAIREEGLFFKENDIPKS